MHPAGRSARLRQAGRNSGPGLPGRLHEKVSLVPGQDPVGVSASFGWLPAGFIPLGGYSVSPGRFGITAQTDGDTVNENVTHISDFALMATVSPQPPEFADLAQQTIPETVDGLSATLILSSVPEAFCVESKVIEPPEDQQPKDPVGELRWTLADGRALSLQSCLPLGTSATDAAAIILHVARTLTTTEAAVSVPFYVNVGNIPSSMKVRTWFGESNGSQHDDTWSFSMVIGASPADPIFSFSVTALNSPDARATTDRSGCEEADGELLCVTTENDKPLPAPLAGLGIKGLLHDLVPLGTDPANWTTDVFR